MGTVTCKTHNIIISGTCGVVVSVTHNSDGMVSFVARAPAEDSSLVVLEMSGCPHTENYFMNSLGIKKTSKHLGNIK